MLSLFDEEHADRCSRISYITGSSYSINNVTWSVEWIFISFCKIKKLANLYIKLDLEIECYIQEQVESHNKLEELSYKESSLYKLFNLCNIMECVYNI